MILHKCKGILHEIYFLFCIARFCIILFLFFCFALFFVIDIGLLFGTDDWWNKNISDVDGLGNSLPGGQLLADYRRLERAIINTQNSPGIEAGMFKISYNIKNCIWNQNFLFLFCFIFNHLTVLTIHYSFTWKGAFPQRYTNSKIIGRAEVHFQINFTISIINNYAFMRIINGSK